ncbi:taurine dioxygenase family [Fusarium circinatum]|uniref:Taurine dioxygenase family n=1 Tax=Fusarium circinatum TaxID=48490 RepID=A0A8H5TNY1_FUSCI|nr:taurine dioxygenase family [Fusarium circinatum]
MGSISTLTTLAKIGGLKEKFRHEDVTPIIGREYAQAHLVHNILESPNADDLVRGLAITVMNSAGAGDAEMSRIDPRTLSTLYKPNGAVGGGQALPTQASPSRPWHSDGPFEVDTPSRRYIHRGRPPLETIPNLELQFWELSSTGNGFQPHARVIAT